MPGPSVPSFSSLRARSYLSRLPLFTRAVIVAIVVFWLVDLQPVWNVREWGALIPDKFGITTSRSPPPTMLVISPFFCALGLFLGLDGEGDCSSLRGG